MVTIAVNLEEYFEKFKDVNFNKKHKGLRKDVMGINFQSYASKIIPSSELYNVYDCNEIDTKPIKLTQMRSQIDKIKRKMV